MKTKNGDEQRPRFSNGTYQCGCGVFFHQLDRCDYECVDCSANKLLIDLDKVADRMIYINCLEPNFSLVGADWTKPVVDALDDVCGIEDKLYKLINQKLGGK